MSSTHIHSFSNEILQKIFQEAIRGRTPPSIREAPYNISHVCDRWRTIALHPMFWKNIVVNDSSGRGVRLFRLFLKRALHRSGSRPASVTYHGRSGDDRQEDWDAPMSRADLSELNFMRFVAQNVNAESFVWKELVLNFSFRGPLRSDPLVSKERFVTLGPFPSVEILSLTAPTDCCAKIQSDLDLSRSSKLRMLSLRGDWDFYNSLLPFAINCRTTLPSLTTLELDLVGDKEGFSSSNQCIRLLGNAPNLHTLTVRSMSGYTSPSAQLLRLENVRKLRVIAAAVQLGTIRNFLYRIKCPRLQQLVVQTVIDEGSDEPVNGFMLDIQGLLQRSKCTLEVLKIQSRLIQEVYINRLLLQVPDLRSLVLSGCDGLSMRILTNLSDKCPDDKWYLDKLRKIIFDRCTFIGENGYMEEGLADDMIEIMRSQLSSRVIPGKGLEVVVSDCGIELDADMHEQLELMKEKGLKFSTQHIASVTEFDDMDEV